ncbi:ATP-binding protein [Streptomyces sp. NBC_00572]|uniref:ATP-binding protein n=1 Tax=Streptomyces sp. NBC_00572 TaxID=2903664 RepID=UPI002251C8D2|nr:ATP-binding protein [Streptomyces sp. NBC_00572]MCX4986682.1 ATP-binding protein [Streptomyces sp. NBC_00572]
MISEPSRYYAVELQALPSRIGQVRRIVSAHLRHWHLDGLIDHAVLGVTELLTNVHRHAQPDKRCTVEIELFLDRLTVSVRDHDPRIPKAGCPDPLDAYDELATSGRGLAIVGAVSESWGVRPCGADGKVVWFTLSTPPPAAPADTRSYAVYDSAAEGPFLGYAPFPGVPLSTPADPAPAPAHEPVLAPAPAVATARRVPAGRTG